MNRMAMNRHGGAGTVGGGAVRSSVAALGIAVAMAGWFDPTRAFAAQQVSLNLTYTCDFPMIGSQKAAVEVDSDIPGSIAVGQSTAHYVVNASATVPWELTVGLHAFGVSTITGTVDGRVEVEAPQGDLAETVPFDIHEINLPSFSSFTGTATGSAPEVTFTEPGRAQIIVGGLTMHLTPRDSNGNLTSLGEMTVPCTLDSGQNDVAATITVTGAASTAAGSSTASSGPDAAPTAHGTSASASASGGASTAVGAGVSNAVSTSVSTLSASPTALSSSTGGGDGWIAWLVGLVALGGAGTAAYRYGPRLWKR